jgi:hypothetical protein
MFCMFGMFGKEGILGSLGQGSGSVHPKSSFLHIGSSLGQDGRFGGHVGNAMFTLGISSILGILGILGIVKLPNSGLLNPGGKVRYIKWRYLVK